MHQATRKFFGAYLSSFPVTDSSAAKRNGNGPTNNPQIAQGRAPAPQCETKTSPSSFSPRDCSCPQSMFLRNRSRVSPIVPPSLLILIVHFPAPNSAPYVLTCGLSLYRANGSDTRSSPPGNGNKDRQKVLRDKSPTCKTSPSPSATFPQIKSALQPTRMRMLMLRKDRTTLRPHEVS